MKIKAIISLNDMAVAAGDNKPDREVLDALHSICAHRRKSEQTGQTRDRA